MNNQRSFSSVVSIVAAVIGMAAFAPAASADEPQGRHVNRLLDSMVRESADAPWTRMYSDIAGFDYQPGYLYEIRIREDAVPNPPADGSSVRRTLVAVLGRTPAP